MPMNADGDVRHDAADPHDARDPMTTDRKTHALQSLLETRRSARLAGKTVVHCHGCFDIVHPGHIQHLQFARSLGDVLVVSVSADTHVNKGVGRPLIPDDLRAASLAALECVDCVYINPDPTAVELLGVLQPDIYVKGKEYETSHDPRFLAERGAVERHGGRVVFSSGEVVYSSTALIGTLGRADPFQEEKLARFRSRYGLTNNHLQQVLSHARDRRVLVIGDYVLDRYHLCDATGVASEGPMLTLRAMQQKDYDGGAGVIALHLAALGARPTLVTAFGDEPAAAQAQLRLQAAGVELVTSRHRRQTVAKDRYLVDQAKLFKVDHGGMSPLDSQQEQSLARQIIEAADAAAAVIFADFGHGLLTAGLLDRIIPTLRQRIPILAADASGMHGSLLRFKQMDLLCPSERELREAQHDFSSGLGAAAWNLLNATDAKQAIVTLGKQGLVTFDRSDIQAGDRLQSEYIPALSAHAVDPLGCGDALLATATLALAAGGSLQAAALLGSMAAGIHVQQMGNGAISLERLTGLLTRQDNQALAA